MFEAAMVDEITRKHLSRARVRGAPSTIPGAGGLIGTYTFEEIQRQTVRALATPLDRDFSMAELRDAQTKLSQLAIKQKLQVLEPPMFSLEADPMEQVPHEWEWKLFLPVSGRALAEESLGVTVARLHGGAYIETITTQGFRDLRNLYTFFLGDFLPARHQQLTRPQIYHRVLSGIESDDPNAVTLAVFLPFAMTLREPVRLVTREEL
jgi:DNA gyrase inhibitor GyrI